MERTVMYTLIFPNGKEVKTNDKFVIEKIVAENGNEIDRFVLKYHNGKEVRGKELLKGWW